MTLPRRITLAVFLASLALFVVALTMRLTRETAPGAMAITATPVRIGPITPIAQDTPRPLPSETTSPTPEAMPSQERMPWTAFLPGVQGPGSVAATATATRRPTSTATFTPTPSPTPTIPWPEALESPGLSKLGLHVQWNNSPEIMEFIRRMKPAVIKAIDDLGFVEEAKEASPETIIVARITHDQPTEGDPEALARAFVADNLPTYRAHPAVDYWEGYNEPDVHGRMEWYARFEAERVRAMAEYGFKAAIGSFSTGVPEYDEFREFLPAVRAARDHGGVLALHEYDAPTFDRTMGAGLPGLGSHTDRGVLAFRYRWWYQDLLEPAGLVIPLVITEAGVDGLVGNRPGPPEAKGWLDFWSYWRGQFPGRDPLYVYLDQLLWYDHQVQQDPYVVGWALFTAGALDDRWSSYDITPYLRHIATEIIAPQAK